MWNPGASKAKPQVSHGLPAAPVLLTPHSLLSRLSFHALLAGWSSDITSSPLWLELVLSTGDWTLAHPVVITVILLTPDWTARVQALFPFVSRSPSTEPDTLINYILNEQVGE